MSEMVDWELAVQIGTRAAGPGPEMERAEASAVVAGLRHDAARAAGLVRDFTGIDAPRDMTRGDLTRGDLSRGSAAQTAPVLVVDRAGWMRANVEIFSTVLMPVVETLTRGHEPKGIAKAVGSRVTGAETGALLGFLGTKVLGQFDPFAPPSGRLLLVAPNIVHVQRELDVDPVDFRLWVCLHEETHRVQFTANPWLREHLLGLITELVGSFDLTRLLDDGLERLGRLVNREGPRGEGHVLDMVMSAEQRQIMDRVTGVMSLLEGHADVVMDGVGPSVIPTVDHIRTAFDERRKGLGVLDRILRRLLGLDQKMAQYRDGAKFVRHVVDRVGMAEFNTVFAGAEQLPSRAEIADPDAWIARVL